jgi:uncharacterized protein with FMN-binding domain
MTQADHHKKRGKARWLLAGAAALAACVFARGTTAEDVVELRSGAKARGKIVSKTDKEVVIESPVGTSTVTRKFPLDRVAAIVRDGKREELNAAASSNPAATNPKPVAGGNSSSKPDPAPGPAPAGGVKRTGAEVEALVDKVGRTPPDWYEATPLNFPQTLDLSWPQPPPQGWNNQKNVGQFIWDIINPNPGKWQEGVKFLHHVLTVNKDNRAVQMRAMDALGRMYHNLLSDYARAAFWWRQAGVDKTGDYPGSAVALAECYFRLGNKQMAMDLLSKLPPHAAMVKLLADMGETAKALQFAEAVARGGAPEVAYMDAGDACRIAGRFQQALGYYEKVLQVPATGQAKGRVEREHRRAQASIEALKLFELSDVKRVGDGTYRAESLGYEGQVEVEVVVAGKRIESVRVTGHKEKQFYSALTETPARIIAKQGVKGVDATSSATITSEAIINATAKALAQGAKP